MVDYVYIAQSPRGPFEVHNASGKVYEAPSEAPSHNLLSGISPIETL